MDCDTARLLLQFTSPAGTDLADAEADELHAHLEQCSACNSLAMNARRLDQHLGQAMNAVAVPAGLNARILDRLTEERGALRRRWLRRLSPYVAAAACLLLMVGGYFVYVFAGLGTVNGNQLVATAAHGTFALPAGAPGFVNYALLAGAPSQADLPGLPLRKSPQLVFVEDPLVPVNVPNAPAKPAKPRKAIIYILPGGQNVARPADDEYEYKLDVRKSNDGKYTYIILYNGDSWEDWLKVATPE